MFCSAIREYNCFNALRKRDPLTPFSVSRTLHHATVCGPEVFMPAEVIISISDDGKDFTELKHIEHKVVKDDKVTFTNFGWEGNAKGRYVRYQATSGEFGGFLFTDEVVIK